MSTIPLCLALVNSHPTYLISAVSHFQKLNRQKIHGEKYLGLQSSRRAWTQLRTSLHAPVMTRRALAPTCPHPPCALDLKAAQSPLPLPHCGAPTVPPSPWSSPFPLLNDSARALTDEHVKGIWKHGELQPGQLIHLYNLKPPDWQCLEKSPSLLLKTHFLHSLKSSLHAPLSSDPLVRISAHPPWRKWKPWPVSFTSPSCTHLPPTAQWCCHQSPPGPVP